MIIGKQDKGALKDLEYLAGCVLLLDKPLGWSSFQAVNKLKWLLKKHTGVKKFKIGHAGTLDPLASGLLIICIGKMTKRIVDFQNTEKEYTGTITLGASRPSYDMETEVDATYPTDHLNDETILAVRSQFIGEIDQVPPLFSAKQIDGKRAYEHARKGRDMVLESCQVNISKLDFDRIAMPEVDFIVRCSKGTYIRSLAHDIGRALDSGAYLASLRRTAIGEFRVENALSITELQEGLGT